MNKKIKKLKKLIRKLYWKKNNQKLYITTYEDFYWKPENRHNLEIALTNKEGNKFYAYLFQIRTLEDFYEPDYTIPTYFREHRLFTVSLLHKASYTPLYFDRIFTLKKFTPITEKDIYNCATYFLRKVLDEFLIFNIELVLKRE